MGFLISQPKAQPWFEKICAVTTGKKYVRPQARTTAFRPHDVKALIS